MFKSRKGESQAQDNAIACMREKGVSSMARFDRFTKQAQEAAARAYDILQSFGQNHVDIEHLMWA
jgi:hypothetical protein